MDGLVLDRLYLARKAKLRYVTDDEPGIIRRRRGRGFSYAHEGGEAANAAERGRIEALVIPPAWQDLWICRHPEGHLQATGRDAAGRKQYLYHSQWELVRDEVKFDRMAGFGHELPTLRTRLTADLRQRRMGHAKVVALAVAVLDRTLIRVGNHRYATDNGSFGLTTMKGEHVDISGREVLFSFQSKGGASHEVLLDDTRLSGLLKQCQELDGQTLFAYVDEGGEVASVTSEDVNSYLRAHMGEFTAKDFRTWGASAHLTGFLGGLKAGQSTQRQVILDAIDSAAEALGNSRAVCRDSYIHPQVLADFESGLLGATWSRTRTGRRMARAERVLARLFGGP
ncbi:DNA topoisomerase IB [soil metagenome]